MSITELSIKRPSLVIVFFTLLIGLGMFSYFQFKYELLPKIDTPSASIVTVYPGASPSDVESSITKPIEDAVASVDKLKRITSYSSEGVSLVFVEFQLTANENVATQDVQRKVNEILETLPKGVKTPTVLKFSLSELPIIRAGVTSNLDAREFYDALKQRIKPQLSQLKGVGQITLVGGEEREIKINLNADALRAYNLSALQVSQALKNANYNLPSGKIKDQDREMLVRVAGKFQSLDDIKNKIIATLPSGSKIFLRDIADVVDGSKETANLNRLNSKSSVGILIQKQSGANAVEVSKLVRAEFEKIESEYAASGMKFDIAQDGSEFTLAAADAVNHDLLIAVFLVAAVMLIFLHSFRSALIVMTAIPASLVSTFTLMYLFGFSLNLMTLLAMSLVIGILVDDSIVVLENIFRHLEMGKDQRTAALDGRNEIGFAALSITLVDVVVFLPMSFVPGIAGNIIREFALVVVFSTLMSLVVSFTITPMLASRFSQLEHLTKHTLMGRFGLWFESKLDALVEWYSVVLAWALKHPKTIMSISGGSLVAALMLPATGIIGGEFIAQSDRGEISVVMELPAGTKFSETNRLSKEIESKISALPEVRKVFANVGASSDGFVGNYASNISELSVSLVSQENRKKSSAQMSREIKAMIESIPGSKVRASPIGLFGTGDGSPIMITVSGANKDSILHAATLVADVMRRTDGADEIRLSIATGKPETRIDIDDERLAQFGLSLNDVAYTLRIALTGDDDSKFRIGETEYPIRLALSEKDRSHSSDLPNLTVINSRGELIEARQVARLVESLQPSKLERYNRASAVTIYAKPNNRAVGDIGADIKVSVEKLALPSGMKILYGGDLELQDDSFGQLGLGFLAAILLVYLVMVALYDSFVYPFVVLFSIPVAMTGAFVALALAGKSLDIFSILGLIMLTGLVAKNAILIVDRTNQMRAEGLNIVDAIMDAGRTRLRPILMTTIAMVIGMLPVALASGAGAEWRSGLGWVLIGGLSSSMFLTLLLVPVVYDGMMNLLDSLANLRTRLSKKRASASVAVEKNTATTTVAKNVGTLLLLVLTGVSGEALAQSATVRLSINDAVAMATEQNAQVQLAKFEEMKSAARSRESIGGTLPTVTANVNYTNNIRNQVFFFPVLGFDATQGTLVPTGGLSPIQASLSNQYAANLTVEMPIFQGDIYANIRSTNAGESAAKASVAVIKSSIVSDVKKAYYNVLIAEAQRGVLEQSLARALESLNESRSLFRQGLATESDTLRAYVAVESARPSLMKLSNSIETARSSLKLLLNLPNETLLSLTDSLSIQNDATTASNIDALYQKSLAERADIRQLEFQRDASDATIEAERAAYLPRLSAIGQLQVQGQGERVADLRFSGALAPVTSFVGLQLSIPVFNGLRTARRAEQAAIQREQSVAQLEFIKRQIRTELHIALSTVKETEQRILVQEKIVALSERSYQAVKSRYAKGLTKQLDLSDASLALTQAKANYLQAVYEHLVAKAELGKILGAMPND